MIERSYTVGSILFTLSIIVHGASVAFVSRPEATQIAGLQATSVLALGNSFQDLAVGVAEALPAPETPPERPDTVQDNHAVDDIVEPQTVQDQTEPETAETIDAVTAQNPTTNAPAPTTPVQPTTTPALLEIPLSTTSLVPLEAVTPALTPTLTALPQKTVTPQTAPAPEQAVQSALKAEPDGSPRLSRRPALRPKKLEQQVAKSRKKPTKTVKKTVKKTPPKKQPQGNGQKQAIKGETNGKAKGSTTATGKKKTGKAVRNANAASDNYRGRVFRQISRQRRPRSTGKAEARVGFVISSSGSISSIRLLKSSGSPIFDNAAIAIVRKASPFPPPPQGARRDLRILIQGR